MCDLPGEIWQRLEAHVTFFFNPANSQLIKPRKIPRSEINNIGGETWHSGESRESRLRKSSRGRRGGWRRGGRVKGNPWGRSVLLLQGADWSFRSPVSVTFTDFASSVSTSAPDRHPPLLFHVIARAARAQTRSFHASLAVADSSGNDSVRRTVLNPQPR